MYNSDAEAIPEVTPITGPEYPEDHPKWYGVPAKGIRQLPGKRRWVFLIFMVLLIEIGLWAVYRWATAPLFQHFGTYEFYFFHIIFAPLIHLGPIFVFWYIFRKEHGPFYYWKRGEPFLSGLAKGLPFVITKKLLFTGMIVGFSAAIIWRVFEELTYDGLAGFAGGTVTGTFTFLNVIETADMVILMTFLMYFIVGPVEEFEFRSFAYDQTARVLPNWQALIFSSVFFGCSHIPIAIFIYKLTPTQFVDALIGWIAAGVTFGVLYIYSRQIVACIVMHGMGNWQLSVFYFMSRPSGGLDPMTSMFIGIATSIISNGIMIAIFWIINEYYWQPHRRGEPAFGGMFLSLQNFMHDHDFGKKPLQTTFAIAIAFMFIISAIIMGATAVFGSRDLPGVGDDDGSGGAVDLESMEEMHETLYGSGDLAEGSSATVETIVSEEDKYIKQVTVTLTWTDEPDMLQVLQNQPDTFSVDVNGPNASASGQDSNPHGAEGRVVVALALTEDQLTTILEEEGENYQVLVDVTMVAAGDFQTPIGVREPEDDGNDYSYEIEVIYLVPEE